MTPALQIQNISHYFPIPKKKEKRTALNKVSFSVEAGEIFGLLGPNGGGKTTLFKILSTLLSPSEGSATVFGLNSMEQSDEVRNNIGVIFQSPSLDKNLTVKENLMCQGRLYAMPSAALKDQITSLLKHFSLYDRRDDIVDQLSGGLKRRVEIVKGILHNPKVLIMDEPSTGLDPKARRDLWSYLTQLKNNGMTILLTTHLMEEAERCDRLGIINQGTLVTTGTPSALKKKIGGDVVSIQTKDPEPLLNQIKEKFKTEGRIIDRSIHIERENGHTFIPALAEAFPGLIDSIAVGKPTLEDVFIHMTGKDFYEKH